LSVLMSTSLARFHSVPYLLMMVNIIRTLPLQVLSSVISARPENRDSFVGLL
jgi:hypothetical protein